MDNIQLKKIDYRTINSYKLKLLESFNFHHNMDRKQREYDFLKETIKLIQKEKSIMYLLTINSTYIGFISLSVSSVNDSPSSQIDYLFVDFNYRKQSQKELDNMLVSKYLILLAIQISEKTREHIAMKYLVLYPDRQSEKLRKYYKDNFGFYSLTKEWLCIKLD